MRRCPVAWWDGERKTGKEATIARGDKRTIVELTPEQIAARQKKREPLNDNPVEATPDGATVLGVFKERLAKPRGQSAAG